MFDEIDTGVSGEISNKMASIMQEMSQYMQVFTITHLPQIAAKGAHHFKVFKVDDDSKTITQLKKLNYNERLEEIAQMLSGKEISETANQIINYLSLLFVPIGVGVVMHISYLEKNLINVLIVIIIGTVLTIGFTAYLMEKINNWEKNDRKR